MLTEKHIKWLEQNDGSYEVRPDSSYWFTEDEEKIQNKIIFVFKSTQFSFNSNGLSEAIDKVLEMYPDSLK